MQPLTQRQQDPALEQPTSWLTAGDWRLYFYYFMHTTGGLGLTLLLLTMSLALKQVRRNPVLISMCFAWWLGAFPNLTLLFYTNKVTGSPPSQGLCLTSAAVVMAQTPLNAMCAVTLVYNVWSVLHFNNARSTFTGTRTFLLVIIPYIVFFIIVGVVLVVGLKYPHLVYRVRFYCIVDSSVLTILIGIFGGLCCLVAIVLEAWIAIILRRNEKKVLHEGMDIQLAFRVVGFGFYIFLGLALSIVTAFDWTSLVPDLCFATFGIAVFLIFGSQKDVLRVWRRWFCCCLPPLPSSASSLYPTSSSRITQQRPTSLDSEELKQWRKPKNGKLNPLTTEKDTVVLEDGEDVLTPATVTDENRTPFHVSAKFQFPQSKNSGSRPGTADSMNKKSRPGTADSRWSRDSFTTRLGTASSNKRPGTAESRKGDTVGFKRIKEDAYDSRQEEKKETWGHELEVAHTRRSSETDPSQTPIVITTSTTTLVTPRQPAQFQFPPRGANSGSPGSGRTPIRANSLYNRTMTPEQEAYYHPWNSTVRKEDGPLELRLTNPSMRMSEESSEEGKYSMGYAV